MKFSLFLLLTVLVVAAKGVSFKFRIELLKSKIQDEQSEISEKLSSTMKDVTEASSLNINNDPIVTPAITELNSYLEKIKTSVDESPAVTNLKQDASVNNSTTNSSNCVDPYILQSVQNVGQAQQFVSSILTNVSDTLTSVSSNFNAMANNNSSDNAVVNDVFSTVTSILQSFLNFTNDQIMFVNDRIEKDVNTFAQAAYNTSLCQPSTTSTESPSEVPENTEAEGSSDNITVEAVNEESDSTEPAVVYKETTLAAESTVSSTEAATEERENEI